MKQANKENTRTKYIIRVGNETYMLDEIEYEIFTIFKQFKAEEKDFLIANAKQIVQAKTEEQRQAIIDRFFAERKQ